MENNWNDLEHEVAKRVAQPGKVGKVIENLGKLGLAGIGAVAIGGCNNPTGSRGSVEPPVPPRLLSHQEILEGGLAHKEYCLANHGEKYNEEIRRRLTANGMIGMVPEDGWQWAQMVAREQKMCILAKMAGLAGDRNFRGSISSYLRGVSGGPVVQGPKTINDFYVWDTEAANPRFRVNDFEMNDHGNTGTPNGFRRTVTHRRLEYELSMPPASRQVTLGVSH